MSVRLVLLGGLGEWPPCMTCLQKEAETNHTRGVMPKECCLNGGYSFLQIVPENCLKLACPIK